MWKEIVKANAVRKFRRKSASACHLETLNACQPFLYYGFLLFNWLLWKEIIKANTVRKWMNV